MPRAGLPDQRVPVVDSWPAELRATAHVSPPPPDEVGGREQPLAAARETVAAQQARADQAVGHLEAARIEARDGHRPGGLADAARRVGGPGPRV